MSTTIETTETTFACETCGETFAKPVSLRNHSRKHKAEVVETVEVDEYPSASSVTAENSFAIGAPVTEAVETEAVETEAVEKAPKTRQRMSVYLSDADIEYILSSINESDELYQKLTAVQDRRAAKRNG